VPGTGSIQQSQPSSFKRRPSRRNNFPFHRHCLSCKGEPAQRAWHSSPPPPSVIGEPQVPSSSFHQTGRLGVWKIYGYGTIFMRGPPWINLSNSSSMPLTHTDLDFDQYQNPAPISKLELGEFNVELYCTYTLRLSELSHCKDPEY
jgi:hypothetical protein